MAKFCVNCGAELNGTECENCGRELYEETVNLANTQEHSDVSNLLVWITAFVPIIGTFLSFGTIVFLVVNILLTYFDEKKLQKAGYDTSKLGNTWFIPVYLFRRANALNHNKAYFIVWCLTFIISFI